MVEEEEEEEEEKEEEDWRSAGGGGGDALQDFFFRCYVCYRTRRSIQYRKRYQNVTLGLRHTLPV